MTAHAKLSASGAPRWMGCPGSVAVHKDRSSGYAREGTAAHLLAEIVQTGNQLGVDVFAGSYIGETLEWFEGEGTEHEEQCSHVVDQEMAEEVQKYVDFVDCLGGKQAYEQRVDFSQYVPDGFGTSDAVIIKDRTLIIADLKYGKGVEVSAVENPQLMLYGLGTLLDLEMIQDFDKVVLMIHQPRRDHVSEWETTPEHLYQFGEEAKQKALATMEPDAPRIPGDKQCQWCSFAALCPERKQLAEHVLMREFDSMEDNPPRNPDQLSDLELGIALENAKLVTSWLAAVEELVVERLNAGEKFPGYKLVEGRSNRVWVDEAKAERKMRKLLGAKEAYTKKLLTAPQAEKKLGKAKAKEIQKLIVKPKGKPTLAPESDERKAIEIVTVEDFEGFEVPPATPATAPTSARMGEETEQVLDNAHLETPPDPDPIEDELF